MSSGRVAEHQALPPPGYARRAGCGTGGSDKLADMKSVTVEVWVWVLIYGGLVTVGVGVFVLRGGAPALGWTLVALGTVATVAGAALLAVRAGMEPPERR